MLNKALLGGCWSFHADTYVGACGAYGRRQPHVALTSDDNMQGSSSSMPVFEWAVVLAEQGEALCPWCLS